MARRYIPPTLPEGTTINRLAPVDAATDDLTPDREVVFLNRGPHTLECQFDARHYEIPPGYSSERYEAVRHFQSRLVVPGGRDPREAERVRSWIVIPGVDPDVECRPFTSAELRAIGMHDEGLDREELPDPRDRRVKKVSTKKAAGRLSDQGSGRRRPTPDGDGQGSEAARRAAEIDPDTGRPRAFKPVTGASKQEEAERRAAGA